MSTRCCRKVHAKRKSYAFICLLMTFTAIWLLCASLLLSKSSDRIDLTTSTSILLEKKKVLSFAIVGFAKCGTTFLNNGLLDIPQLYLGPRLDNGMYAERPELRYGAHYRLVELYSSSPDTTVNGLPILKGIKHPGILFESSSLRSLVHTYPEIKLIVTMRHPILQFQSFYNHRIKEGFHLPPPESLIGFCGWDCDERSKSSRNECVMSSYHVCTEFTAYHHGLSRLQLTPMDTIEENKLLDTNGVWRKYLPNVDSEYFNGMKGEVFLIENNQMNDKDTDRNYQFERDMENFLGLQKNSLDIEDARKRYNEINNREKQMSKSIAGERFDICQKEYGNLRNELLSIGKKASQWIIKYFIASPQVIVSSQEYFVETLQLWQKDPCAK